MSFEECFETQCGGQFNLPQEQGETVCFLEVDCDQASPVGPCEVERVHGTEGYMPSLGEAEASRSLELTQTPSVIVPGGCVGVCEWCECHGMRECMWVNGTRTDPDGRREWRAW